MPLASCGSLPLLDRVVVESSLLAKVAYDHQRAILQVEFRDGALYRYLGVPIQTYQDLLRADSKGAYFNHHIRSAFPYAMVQGRATAPSGQPNTIRRRLDSPRDLG